MKKIIIPAALLLSACGTPTYISGNEYAFVGCHTVVSNPSVTGERTFMGFFDLRIGDKLWFKQISPNNKVKAVMKAVPC
jgi:hypothetical protein